MAARLISCLAFYLSLVDASIYDPSKPEPKNQVTIYKSIFATLDDIWPFQPISMSAFYDKRFRKLPLGWSPAKDSRDTRIAIQLYKFGTDNIVLHDSVFNRQLDFVRLPLIIDNNLGIKANVTFPHRILIKKDTLAPVEKAPFVIANITNFITYQGRDYAMVNNADPRDQAKKVCDPHFYALNDRWRIVRDIPDTKAILVSSRFSFGYTCKVTDSGQGYSYFVKDPECEYPMLTRVRLYGQRLFAVTDRTCGAVMVSRPSRNSNTWDRAEAITNVYKVTINDQEHHYAVLDNTPANKPYSNSSCSGDDCCQNVAINVPREWELAQSTMPGYTEAASQPWGTYCTGLSDKGKPCNYKVISTGGTFNNFLSAVRYCDSRVLIKRKSIDCVSSWTEWSECSDDCVRTRRRARFTREAQFGGVCKMFETEECQA